MIRIDIEDDEVIELLFDNFEPVLIIARQDGRLTVDYDKDSPDGVHFVLKASKA